MSRKWYLLATVLLWTAIAGAVTTTATVIFVNFNSGELSPLMNSRSDYPKYPSGARTLQNMLVRPQGPIERRPGTRFIAEVKDSSDPARLIPFEYSTEDAYVIELGDLYARFYRSGDVGPISAIDANAYEIVTPWDANDLFELQYAQDSQYMRIVHPNYPPYKLTRTAHAAWTCTEIDFAHGPFLDENSDTDWTITPSATTGAITMDASEATWDANHVDGLWRLSHTVDANTVKGTFTSTSWVIGSEAADQNGSTLAVALGQEFTITTSGFWRGTIFIQKSYDDGTNWIDVYSMGSVGLTNLAYTGTESVEAADYRLKMTDHLCYRPHADEYYFTFNYTMVSLSYVQQGIVRISAVTDACDVNATVLADSPLGGTSATYQWAEGAWSTYRGFPRTVEHYEQRCIYGGSTSFPQTIWGSITAEVDDDYDVFAEGAGDDGDAWTYILPGMNPIQWLRAQTYLMIGTTAAIGRLGTEAKPLTPSWTEYKIQARNGSAYIQPASALDSILFVERGGRKIREIQYTYQTEHFTASDKTVLAEHITDPGIVQIDFQNRPDPILWCVRSDGVMATFTYQPEHEVEAWAEQITGQDVNDWDSWDDFESVAIIPGGSTQANGDARVDDEVWVVVARTVNSNTVRYVEQFQALDWGDDPNYCWFVDCAGSSEYALTNTEVNEVEATTYTMSYFSESNRIVGIPLGDQTLLGSLDNAAARDVGDGTVGLPYTGHPFNSGDSIRVTGTTAYDGTYTVLSATSTDEIVVTPQVMYFAETFDGNEPVIVQYTGLPSGLQAMVRDDTGVLHYGMAWDAANNSYIYSLDPNGNTVTYDAVTWPGSISSSQYIATALQLNSANTAMYALLKSSAGWVAKFDFATGANLWISDQLLYCGYDMDIDSSGRAYVASNISNAFYQLASADGAKTALTSMGYGLTSGITDGLYFDVHVDNDIGVVSAGGKMYCLYTTNQDTKDTMYNFAVRTFNDSAGDTILLGSLYDSGLLTYTPQVHKNCTISDGTNMYVLVRPGTGGCTLYKLSWNGSSLSNDANVAGPTYGCQVFQDMYDNIVIVNQISTAPQETIFYYYDTNLNYLGTLTDMYTELFKTWNSGQYLHGVIQPNGSLGGSTVATTEEWQGATYGVGLTQCVYADGKPIGTFVVDANGTIDLEDDYTVVIAGLNYYSIYESMPLVSGTQAGSTQMGKNQITEVAIDFYQTMGANLGATYDESTELTFSDDDFATAIDPWSGIKVATFPRGVTRDPVIYMWEWEPIPMCMRAIRTTYNADY